MTWTLRDEKRERAIVDKIDSGDGRSAAILAEAFLEDRLTKSILAHLRKDKTTVGVMFKGYGPLASFKAKIDLAFLMEIISPHTHEALHHIREIRNRFAHRLDAHDFDVQLIADLCKRLYGRTSIIRLLDHFEQVFKGDDMAVICRSWLAPMIAEPETPRSAYMNTVKIILFFLEMHTDQTMRRRGDGELSFSMTVLKSLVEPLPDKFGQQPLASPQNEDRD